ncbi:MAG: nicotinate-nucleotide adenylyltransferase [Opitutales bacterium]|nr:nicotinate-nucleotide adenylyltransferase [Opitutales bacterium]
MNKKLEYVYNLPVTASVALIGIYRKFLSPILHALFGPETFCRFQPTCSAYAIGALQRHGFMKGTLLAFWRILRCNPFVAGGADPIPPKGRWRNVHEKVGILGGSFDPVHNAHLALAETARDALGLDRVIFVPVAQSPLKDNSPHASIEARKEMLEVALRRRTNIEVSVYEIEKGGISYSIETAKHFVRKFPFAELYWLLGADQFANLDKWKDIEELAHIVRFAVMCRGGDKLPPLPPELQKVVSVEMLEVPPLAISSTYIRQKATELTDKELGDYVPEGVVEVIRSHKLYQPASAQNSENQPTQA